MKLSRKSFAIMILGLLAPPYGSAYAIDLPLGHRPKICLGYTKYAAGNGEVEHWGYADERGCFANQAIYSGQRGLLRPKTLPPLSYPFQSDCCPLPADDILTEEKKVVNFECPPDFVATATIPFDPAQAKRNRPVVCTKINTARYQLAPPSPGVYWGFGSAYWRNAARFERRDIPAAIRYGVGRNSRFEYDIQGCIGYPFGSVLIAKATSSPRCAELRFSQIQYRGLPGDPPQGTPVKMFPDCSDVTDVFDPQAGCINE